ncbi:hypothetical protein DU918_20440 [Salmonella enterica subsp. enterica serovar Saintpaul]|nr:hypothetical protein [Salmonella enterica subsp. enterica serovar Saintpaul]EDQ2393988.1 hypothetical protein [Salmonella enterica subsp. enterica]
MNNKISIDINNIISQEKKWITKRSKENDDFNKLFNEHIDKKGFRKGPGRPDESKKIIENFISGPGKSPLNAEVKRLISAQQSHVMKNHSDLSGVEIKNILNYIDSLKGYFIKI